MTHAFRSLGFAVTLLALLGCSTAAQAQTPPKDMVPLKMVKALKKLDAAASFTLPMTFPVVYTKLVGTVDGSPLGPATAIGTDRTYVGVDGKELWYEGEGAWTAANGDAIFFTYVGLVDPPKAGFVITGGKGRFQGATGSGVFTYTVNATGTEFETTYEGFISAPRP
jgi:hypothetical protein